MQMMTKEKAKLFAVTAMVVVISLLGLILYISGEEKECQITPEREQYYVKCFDKLRDNGYSATAARDSCLNATKYRFCEFN